MLTTVETTPTQRALVLHCRRASGGFRRSACGARLCWCCGLHAGAYLNGCDLLVKLLLLLNAYRSLAAPPFPVFRSFRDATRTRCLERNAPPDAPF